MALRYRLAAALAALAATVAEGVKTAAGPKHLILLMLENHSFDNMLGWLKANNSAIDGLSAGSYCIPDLTGAPVCATPDAAYVDPDPEHSVEATAYQVYGMRNGYAEHDPAAVKMDGFILSMADVNRTWAPQIMKGYAPQDVPVIATLASEFAVFDGFFSAVPGPTYVNRLFAQSGTSHGFGTNDAMQTVLGWPQPPFYALLDSANVTWRVYFEDAPTSILFDYTRSLEALGKHRLMDRFFKDVAAGDLPAVTWLDPSYFDIPLLNLEASDEHPGHDVAAGERLLKKVYDALRASPLWNDVQLVITFDEHGGLADHVPTPVTGVPSPDGLPCRDCKVPFNFTRLGVRVPYIAVGPWVPKGQVIHASSTSAFELSSLVTTVREFSGISTHLTARDAWAQGTSFVWDPAVTGMTAPRTDCPTAMPEPPAASPAFASRPLQRRGKGGLSHLQRDLLKLMAGAVGALPVSDADAAGDRELSNARVEALLDGYMAAHGLRTEEEVGLHMRQVLVPKLLGGTAVSAA